MRPTATVLLCLTLGTPACRERARPVPKTRSSSRVPKHPSRRPRVVLIQLGGLPADWLERWLTQRRFLPGQPPATPQEVQAGGLARLARGVQARLVPVDPTLTAPNLVTMATGALPRTHGVISNRFYRRGKRVLGFTEPVGAETLWQAALRQGRRVLTWVAVGARCQEPLPTLMRSACYATRRHVGPSRRVVVQTHPTSSNQAGPARLGSFIIQAGTRAPGRRRLEVAVELDRFGAIALRVPRGVRLLGGGASHLRPGATRRLLWPGGRTSSGETAPLRQTVVNLTGVNRHRGTCTFYVGRTAINLALPATFRLALDRADVIRPGPADRRALKKGLVDEHLFVETALQELETLVRLARWLATVDSFELAVLYLAAVDAMTRALWAPANRSELAPEEVKRYHTALEQGLRRVDNLLAKLLEALDLQRTRVVLASDHGMLGVHTDVSLKAALGSISPDIKTVSSGSTAFIHLPAGVGQSRVMQQLRSLKVGQRSVFSKGRVTSRSGFAPLGLPPRAADLFVQAGPGFTLSDRRSRRLTSWPWSMASSGQQSGLAAIQAVLLAAGPGIRRVSLPRLRMVQIAALVADALGIQPPRQAATHRPHVWAN